MRTVDDDEIRAKGILALNKALGPTAALRFLTLLRHDPTDYVAISRELYEGQSVDDIFERVKKVWKNGRSRQRRRARPGASPRE